MATNEQRVSKRQEGRITKSLKQIGEEARRQMASGALWFAKSDIVSKKFHIEAKTRARQGAKSITIKRDWLDKVAKEALETGKAPALAFSFGDNKDYFVIEDRDFYSLIGELNRLRDRVTELEFNLERREHQKE